MVVLGNLLGKELGLGISSPEVEIIYKSEDLKKVKDSFNLPYSPVFGDSFTSVYNTKKGKVILYNADKMPILRKIYESSFTRGNFKFAPLIYAYIWAKSKITYIHKHDIREWENTLLIYDHLNSNYFGDNISEEQKKEIENLYYQFNPVVATNNSLVVMPHKYKPFEMYSRKELLDLFTMYKKGSLYNELLVGSPKSVFGITRDLCSRVIWEKFTHQEKIDAVIERIFADVANEFLIDDIFFNKTNSLIYGVTNMITMCFMYAISHTECKWMSNFILDNYIELWSNIDIKTLELLYEAVECDYLSKLTQ